MEMVFLVRFSWFRIFLGVVGMIGCSMVVIICNDLVRWVKILFKMGVCCLFLVKIYGLVLLMYLLVWVINF